MIIIEVKIMNDETTKYLEPIKIIANTSLLNVDKINLSIDFNEIFKENKSDD